MSNVAHGPCVLGDLFSIQTLEVWYFMLFRLDHFIKVILHYEYFHKLLEKKNIKSIFFFVNENTLNQMTHLYPVTDHLNKSPICKLAWLWSCLLCGLICCINTICQYFKQMYSCMLQHNNSMHLWSRLFVSFCFYV